MGTPPRLDARKGIEMGCVNTMLSISRCIEGVRGRLPGRLLGCVMEPAMVPTKTDGNDTIQSEENHVAIVISRATLVGLSF